MPFGTDFGNGERDRQFFQVDGERDRYLQNRRATAARGREVVDEPGLRSCHARVSAWMADAWRAEHPQIDLAGEACAAIFRVAQEDFAVIHRDAEDRDRAVAMFVSFPSGWYPERAIGGSFREIHGPVPDFGEVEAANRSMLSAMIERGPYTRFVWTVSADDFLDHHPERGRRLAWSSEGHGWLRVERQVTVPFPEVSASLFLIRTYLYSFAELSPEQRAVLATALELMPRPVALYKGLTEEARATAVELLRCPVSGARE